MAAPLGEGRGKIPLGGAFMSGSGDLAPLAAARSRTSRPIRCHLALLCAAALFALVLSACSAKAKLLGSTPLHWVAVDTGVESVGVLEHAGLMVDAKIGDQDVWVQLDTGSKYIVLRPTALDALGLSYTRDESTRIEAGSLEGGYIGVIPSFSFVGTTAEKPQVILWEESENAPSVTIARIPEDMKPYVGTLGGAIVKKSVLALDFEHDEIRVYDRMPPDAHRAAVSFPASGGAIGVRPTMNLKVGGTELLAMYDTGSSAYEIMLRTSDFLHLTGLSSLDEAPLCHSAKSWNNAVTVYGIPFSEAVEVGGRQLNPKRIWASSLMDALYESCGCEVLIGNELFIGHTVYLDFTEKRFAIVEGD